MLFKSWFKLNSNLTSSLVAILGLVILASLQIPNLNQLLTKSKNSTNEEIKKELKTEQKKLLRQ